MAVATVNVLRNSWQLLDRHRRLLQLVQTHSEHDDNSNESV